MRLLIPAMALFAIFPCLPAHAEMIYKCKTADGKLQYQEKPCSKEASSITSWGSEGGGSMKVSQGDHGHYFVDGSINEQALNFVIDTGATSVAVPQALAYRAGLQCIRQTVLRTSNGNALACSTRIAKLKFGNFSFRDVEAIIAPNLDQPLLGMNILKEFRIEQDSGEMLLSKR